MVSWISLQTLLNDGLYLGFVFAQKDAQIPLRRLDGPTRVKVLAAMAGLIILGFGMIALAWLGGRFTRRYMKSGERPSRSEELAEDWATKPLVGQERRTDANADEVEDAS